MSDTTKKLSLLNKINSIKDNDNYNDEDNVYHFGNIGKLVINNVFIFVPEDTTLEITLKNNFITFNTIKKTLPIIEIEYENLQDLYLLIRDE